MCLYVCVCVCVCVCVWLVRISGLVLLTSSPAPHTKAHAHTHNQKDNHTPPPPPHTETHTHPCTNTHIPSMKANSPPLDPYPHTARPHTLIRTWTVDVCVCVCVDWFVRVGACLCVGDNVYPWVRGCVCGCVGVGVSLNEVWGGFVCVCGRVAPTSSHTPTHRRTPARRNKQEVTHPPTCKPNHTTIHKPTQTHTPHTKAHPHTCAHVACSQGACRGVWGGGTLGVRTNEGVHKGEIGMNSREFT